MSGARRGKARDAPMCDHILLTLVVFEQNFGDFAYKIRGSQQDLSTPTAHKAPMSGARAARRS